MCKILIALCAFIALSSCAEQRGPSSHYLTPAQLNTLVNFTDCYKSTDGDDIYRYSIPNLNKTLPNITFSEFKGKVILILNVATYCISPIEYPQLNKLKEEFGDKLVIVGFPCAQFLNQEPEETAEEILNGIRYVRPGKGFVPKFLLTQKVEVNGANAHPVFSYLKRSCLSTSNTFTDQKLMFWDPKNDRDVKWNFEKFLIDPESGKPVRRYPTSHGSYNIAQDIKALLNKTPLN